MFEPLPRAAIAAVKANATANIAKANFLSIKRSSRTMVYRFRSPLVAFSIMPPSRAANTKNFRPFAIRSKLSDSWLGVDFSQEATLMARSAALIFSSMILSALVWGGA
ncbi:MAG: hypothetical protein WBD54_06140, partial [Candidatus Acidiferrales bacterium]